MYNPPQTVQQIYYNGVPASGALMYSYVAGNSNIPHPVYYNYQRTTPTPNPLVANAQGIFPQYFLDDIEYKFVFTTSDGLTIATPDYISSSGVSGYTSDTYKVMSYSGDGDPDYLFNKIIPGNNMTISLSGDSVVFSTTTMSATSDHKVLVDGVSDPAPGYLFDKIVPGPNMIVSKTAGISGEAIELSSAPVVSADGSDVPGYLINKLSALNTPIGFESYNGKVNLTFNYSGLSSYLTNTPYAVWFSNASGNLVGTDAFTFGDPSRQGALYTPSMQVMSSIVMGNNAGFWDDSNFVMNYPAIGGTVQLTPGYSNTRYIYAHNGESNASIFTDKACFANLANNGMVFASMWPHSSEDAIYLHTADGLSFNPTSNVLTAPNLAIGSLSAAGILTNDASGNVSSVPASTFTDSQQVLVSSLDTTAGYLGTKLAAGTNIGFSVTSDSHGQKLWISARSNMLLNPTYVTANYAVVDTDMCVAVQTNNDVTITLPTPGSTYNGRGLYVYGCGTGTVIINTVSGGIRGYTPTISGYGKLMFRCLKSSDNNYYWMCGD